ncbi:TadE/TadG family type IV pilus assembly protein [Qipengyuania flava]|uniref:TadE/TadG family type IV pilus assembly protein n=1 Tax=Qipengyuania flava TaxID=192812 RepID=UPI001C6371B8|nr:TadE/TadG family type IV pilus assembly protein [Qipengyuania flava]QYJ06471.1 pilus assembly protein [Qipengyuania flava]
MRPVGILRQLRRDEEGATIVEFAMIAAPMLLLLLGGLDLGYQSYIRSTMQGALNDAARAAAVENPIIGVSGNTVEEQVENLIKNTVSPISPNATISVTQKSYFDFSSVGNPEKLMTDNNGNGLYDDDDGDCFEDANGNGTFDTDAGADGIGGADDVVLYTATISAPRLMPIHAFLPGLGSTIEYTLETAVRNQPYETQATPSVICA